jgi:hypothetical protein
MKLAAVILAVVMAGATVPAQQAVPPPPQPASDKPAGPSLEVTMKFIQDKLNEIGTVNFAAYFHDSSDNSDWVQKISVTYSNAVANPGACSFSYHRLAISNGSKQHDENVIINLHDVQSIVVLPNEQNWQMHLARNGDTTNTIKDVPDIYDMNIKLPKGDDYSISFYEQETADRVAKAMVHAVELCGGGPKPEPF